MANVLFPYGAVEGFGYNNDYTLFAVGGWSGSSQFYSRIYTRDAAGRVTQVTNPQTPAPTPTPMVTIPAVSSASYLVNNQLSKWNGTSVTEDANGNLLSDGLGNSFVWNERNQLATLETPNVKELLQYDAFGRRQFVQNYQNGGESTCCRKPASCTTDSTRCRSRTPTET